MSLLTTLNNVGIETSIENALKLSGQASVSDARGLYQRGQAITSVSRDLKIQAGISPIVYVGSLGTASDNTSGAGLLLQVPDYITPGLHVILLIEHSSGGSVISVSDSQSNVWTIDQPSIFNGTLGIAVASARITSPILSGDNILIT
jgi:hypothetical protein